VSRTPRRMGWPVPEAGPLDDRGSLGEGVRERPADPGTRPTPGSPLKFFILVFALSTPIWLLGAMSRRQLSADLPVSSFIWVTPALAASILVYRENGTAGATALPRRWRTP
jgi:hypothetical protein